LGATPYDVGAPVSDTWTYDKTEESPEEEAFAPLKYEIVNYPADTTLKGYLDLWKSDQLMVPEFQREYVWDQKKASKLIESFLLGLPVPGVFLFKPKNSNQFQIVDGQQRIMSAIKFQQEIFDEKGVFRLRGVQKEFEGKKFSEFSEELRFKIETSVLRATIIQQLSPNDNTSIYQIFERLNTGGVNLNPMEIRQSVSYGPFVSLLKDLNRQKEWRELLGKARLDKRLRDVELILRVIALNEWQARYEKPMKGFLNEYMEFRRNTEHDYPAIRERFSWAVAECRKQLGPTPFHLRGRLNYGVLDSVLVAIMANGTAHDLLAKFNLLKVDDAYLHSVSFNTSDAAEVEARIGMAKAALA